MRDEETFELNWTFFKAETKEAIQSFFAPFKPSTYIKAYKWLKERL